MRRPLRDILNARRAQWEKPVVELQLLGADLEPICEPLYGVGKFKGNVVATVLTNLPEGLHGEVCGHQACVNGFQLPVHMVDVPFPLSLLVEFRHSATFTPIGGTSSVRYRKAK